MNITYRTDYTPGTEAIITVYNSSGIIRPTADSDRITRMYANSDLVVTAWNGELLVGIARTLTDFCYVCYLSDLAVHKDYQKGGIGKKLIDLTKEVAGDQCTLVLLSAPAAIAYYPNIGMEKPDNAFVIKRKS